MNIKGVWPVISIVASVLFIVSCATGAGTTSTPPPPRAVIAGSSAGTWQEKWDKVVSEAKKEGKLVIATSTGTPIRKALTESFTGKYNVELEFVSGKPAEVVPKVQGERRAGLYLVDMFIAGPGTVTELLGPDGALEPLDSILILPEVLDKKAWVGGDLLWQDKEHYQLIFLAFPHVPITINTDIVGADEVSSYRDLLNPKWKGKIVYLDPTMAGSGNRLFTMAEYGLIDMDWIRRMADQVGAVTRDERIMIEWVVRGKYPIGVGIKPELQTEFKQLGAPIKALVPKEGTYVAGAGAGLVYMKKAPHPNAATLFINWLLTKEGGTVISRAWGGQSAREDVATDFLEPDMVRKPGMKYVVATGPEEQPVQQKYMKIAREVWGNLLN